MVSFERTAVAVFQSSQGVPNFRLLISTQAHVSRPKTGKQNSRNKSARDTTPIIARPDRAICEWQTGMQKS
jgi:hypothetical protein